MRLSSPSNRYSELERSEVEANKFALDQLADDCPLSSAACGATARDAVQLAPACIGSTETFVHYKDIQFRRVAYNVSAGDSLGSLEHRLTFAYLQEQGAPVRIDGRLWPRDRLAVIYGPAKVSTSGPALLMILELDATRVPMLEELFAPSAVKGNWLSLLPSSSFVVRDLQRVIADAIAPNSSAKRSPPVERTIALALRTTELALHPKYKTSLNSERQRFVDAAENFMWSNISEGIGLSQVSRGAGCSPRTLSNYYRNLYGISPMRYFKLLRFNHVRRALRNSGPAKKTVSDIAADHGFWHMGHFSEQYRDFFGETATETMLNVCVDESRTL